MQISRSDGARVVRYVYLRTYEDAYKRFLGTYQPDVWRYIGPECSRDTAPGTVGRAMGIVAIGIEFIFNR